MDIHKALEIISITTFKDINDIEFYYKKELQKAEVSYKNAFNDTIKQEYLKKIQDLKSAFKYINDNKELLNKSKPLEMPALNLSAKQKKTAIIIGVLVTVIIGFFVVRSYIANSLLEEGKLLFSSKNYEKAIKKFEKSNNYGSIEARYYYGKTLYFMNPEYRSRGFKAMKEAVDNYAAIDSIEKRLYNRLLTKNKILNKND